jgi:hypothetical protein
LRSSSVCAEAAAPSSSNTLAADAMSLMGVAP